MKLLILCLLMVSSLCYAAPGDITTYVKSNDPRLTDTRTPKSHATTHGAAGADPVTVTQGQVTGLTTALSGKQATLSNASTLGKISESGGNPLWNGGTWPGGGGSSENTPTADQKAALTGTGTPSAVNKYVTQDHVPQKITNGPIFPDSPSVGDVHFFPLQVEEFGGNPLLRPLLDSSLDGLSVRDTTAVKEGDGTYSLFYGGYWSTTQVDPPENQEYLFKASSTSPQGGFVRKGIVDVSGSNYATYYTRHSVNSPSFVFQAPSTWHMFANGRVNGSDVNSKAIAHWKATGTASQVPTTGWVAYAPAFVPQGSGWTSEGSPAGQVYLPHVVPKEGGGWIMYLSQHGYGTANWSVGYITSTDLETWTDGGKLIGGTAEYDCEYGVPFKAGGYYYLLVHQNNAMDAGLDIWVSTSQTGTYTLALADVVERGNWKALIGDAALFGYDMDAEGYLDGVFDANNAAVGFGANSIGGLRIMASPDAYRYNGDYWERAYTTGAGVTLPPASVAINEDRLGFGTTLPGAKIHIAAEWPSVLSSHLSMIIDGYGDQPRLSQRRANGTQASPTATMSGDALGNFGFRGHTGTAFGSTASAAVAASADGNFSPSSTPARVGIFTTAVGSTSSVEHFRVGSSGRITAGVTLPTDDGATELQTTSLLVDSIKFRGDSTTQTTAPVAPTYSGTAGLLALLNGSGGLTTADATYSGGVLTIGGNAFYNDQIRLAVKNSTGGNNFTVSGSGRVDATSLYIGGAAVSASSGTVTSITPGTGFTSATPITTSGTLNVNTGTGASQVAAQDASGNLGIGITATDRLHVYKSSSTGNVTSIFEGVLPAGNGPYLTFKKATYSGGSPVALGSGDIIGGMLISGATGAGTYDSVRSPFQIIAAEAWTTTTGGWDLSFKTRATAQGSLGAAVERLRIPSDGGIRLLTATEQPCDSTHRGTFNYVAGGAGVKDTVKVCAKDAGDAYAWRTIY